MICEGSAPRVAKSVAIARSRQVSYRHPLLTQLQCYKGTSRKSEVTSVTERVTIGRSVSYTVT